MVACEGRHFFLLRHKRVLRTLETLKIEKVKLLYNENLYNSYFYFINFNILIYGKNSDTRRDKFLTKLRYRPR